MEASGNKAERTAIAETLEARAASMGKFATAGNAKGGGKNQNPNRRRKACERRLLQISRCCLLMDLWYTVCLQELTQEELDQKNFTKDLQARLNIFSSMQFKSLDSH